MFHRFMLALTFVVVFIVAAFAMAFYLPRPNLNQVFGVSFNSEYASYLGLDPKEVLTKIFDDWGFCHLRLSIQWDEVEKTEGKYDFSELDWQMNEAAKRDAKIVLAIGQKTPRWPECHVPDWTKELDAADYSARLKKFVAAAVERYRQHPSLEIWQVENEPFLPFGLCRPFSKQDLVEEIAMIRRLDNSSRPVLVTDSGELGWWFKAAKAGDLFGTTIYRVVWHKRLGYFPYDWLPAGFYRLKLWLTGLNSNQAVVSELQAEPWVPDLDVKNWPLEEQYKSLDMERFQKTIDFSRRVGFPRAYLWGAEWWAWLAKQSGGEDFGPLLKELKKE